MYVFRKNFPRETYNYLPKIACQKIFFVHAEQGRLYDVISYYFSYYKNKLTLRLKKII